MGTVLTKTWEDMGTVLLSAQFADRRTVPMSLLFTILPFILCGYELVAAE